MRQPLGVAFIAVSSRLDAYSQDAFFDTLGPLFLLHRFGFK